MLLLQQMIVLLIYMLLGLFGAKKGVLTNQSAKTFSWLVVNAANPALIILPTINKQTQLSGKQVAEALALAAAIYVVLIVLAQIVIKLMRIPQEERGLYQLMLIFNNIAFMGFPIVEAAYGPDALLYAALFTLPFSLLIYTYGIALITQRKEKVQYKNILNIGVAAVLIAIVMLVIRPNVPKVIVTAMTGISNLTGPLSMIVIGISLSQMRLRELFCDVRLLIFSAIKLLIIPIIGTLAVVQVLDNELLCRVCMVMLGTPAASMVVMLAQTYDGDFELASRGIALTTLLSVATIPLVSAIVF